MGKKSRRNERRKKADEAFPDDAIMALSINCEEKPKSAKQRTKLSKKLRKLQKREKKQEQKRLLQKGKSLGWNKIEVTGSEAMEKNFIYTSIGSSVEVEFQPLGFHKIDNTCCFYLEDNEPAASAMESLDRRIQGPNGNLLKINSTRVSRPDLALNSEQLQVLREVMARRFQSDTCLLDLSHLHHDPALLEKDILAPLAAPLIMKQVIRVIKENIPHLKALNISKNSLNSGLLGMCPGMLRETCQLFALNVEHNALKDFSFLNYIKQFPISELSLQFNPIVEMYKDRPLKYIRMVKKTLEQLKILDTVDVEAYLRDKLHDHGEAGAVQQPTSSSSTAGPTSAAVSEPLIRSFLDQYYALVDAPDRSALVAAYTPDAVLEMKSDLQAISSSTFVGQDEIKTFLLNFPRTHHQHSTFSFNIKFPEVNLAQAVIMGQCKIHGLVSVVTFARTMNIVPFNAGLCCSRDSLEFR